MDVTCAHCGEPWDVDGLRHDAAEYLDANQADMLQPLGDDIVAAFERSWTTDPTGADAQIVNKAVTTAVLRGRGCLICGFRDVGARPGPHRGQQLREIVLDGVTDEDAASFL